jgi:hypothetical protein
MASRKALRAMLAALDSFVFLRFSLAGVPRASMTVKELSRLRPGRSRVEDLEVAELDARAAVATGVLDDPTPQQLAARAPAQAHTESRCRARLAGRQANIKAVTFNQWRTYAYKRGISGGEQRAKEKAFERAAERLIGDETDKHVAVWGEHVWPTEE